MALLLPSPQAPDLGFGIIFARFWVLGLGSDLGFGIIKFKVYARNSKNLGNQRPLSSRGSSWPTGGEPAVSLDRVSEASKPKCRGKRLPRSRSSPGSPLPEVSKPFKV